MKRAFITGINGFVGQWLARHLQLQGYEIYGIDLQEHCIDTSVKYQCADLLDGSAIATAVHDAQPEMLFNLAGVTYLPEADSSPSKALNANISGTMNILDAVRNGSPTTRILLVGSSREYAERLYDTPLTEEMPTRATNFYGISKLCSELIGLQYHRQFGIDVRCTRSFNHTGPGQSPRFVCSEWAQQIARIALGKADPALTVGELDTIIDFSDVRDVADAYYRILADGSAGEVYNVCSGSGIDLKWILDYLASKAPQMVTIAQSSDKIRTKDRTLRMVGSAVKLTDATGWKPKTPLQKTLDDLYEWWMRALTVSGVK